VSYENLKLFRDITQIRSFSKAAAMNGISQSAVSQQIQDLEKAFGVELLDRSHRPLVVTEAGRLYGEFCRDVLRRKEEFDVALDEVRKSALGTVRVAAIYSVGLSEMVEIEEEFARREPGAQLEVDYLRPEKVYSAVLADEADLGLVSYPEPSREIHVIPWRMEEMVLAASPHHKLAAFERITPKELEGAEFIGFDEDLPIQHAVDRFLREHGVEVSYAFHFDNLQMVKEAVAHGVGVSIMPARVMLDEMSQGRLVAVGFGESELYRPLGIIHRKKKRFHRAAQAFLDLLRERPAPDLGFV
jgi:LysR family transcriptional regulator, transcriptional activator of the cysJI operon